MTNESDSAKHVELYEQKGDLRISIDAAIDDKGNFLVSGQELGESVRKFWGDDDYEYWLFVSKENKDRLLLALIKRLYAGNANAVGDLCKWLRENDIPYVFDSYA